MGLAAIDLGALGSAAERERLRQAACGAGAFVLRGHGVDERARTALLACSRAFFALPQAERDAIDMIGSPYFRGYSASGTERTLGRPDLREQLDVGPEEVAPQTAPGDAPYVRLQGPNLWPAALPALPAAVLGWMRALRAVSTRLTIAIFEAIGLPSDALAAGFSGTPHERLKLIKYLPAGEADADQGVGEHSDSGFITLIVQDGSRGLEVHDGRHFAGVHAADEEMIVILGRALRAASHDALAAPVHRVVSPPGGGERISVSYFLNPRLDHDGYGYEALKVLLRSHPQTAAKYFPDLLAAGGSDAQAALRE